MDQQQVVNQQFGNTAAAYLTSSVHASGQDLSKVAALTQHLTQPQVLDLGCGAGHVSFTVAPYAASVIAYDLAPAMLRVVAQAAIDKGLQNIQTQQGVAEQLPFADQQFDLVITRFSAHHWQDVPAALAEIKRVLRPNGRVVVIDIVAAENPLFDTILQSIELLRDASHVRDYRCSEWIGMTQQAGFDCVDKEQWTLKMEFATWVARMQTPADKISAIRGVFKSASTEVKTFFKHEPDDSFVMQSAFFELQLKR